MRSFLAEASISLSFILALLVGSLVAIATVPVLSHAETPANSIRVVNNSNLQIRNLFLAPVNTEDWGPDQLPDDTVIAPGGSFTINDVTCSGSEIKVIAEDADGCFLSTTVTCSASAVWTITNSDSANCGGQ